MSYNETSKIIIIYIIIFAFRLQKNLKIGAIKVINLLLFHKIILYKFGQWHLWILNKIPPDVLLLLALK